MGNDNNYKNNHNTPRFVKEPATAEAQLMKLEVRGCVIEDITYAKQILEKINYYRLANYFAVFMENGKRYREGTSFNKVIKLYEFDRRLRGYMLIFLEEIEISMRAVISNFHALKYGALGYLNDASFGQSHFHHRFISRVERLIETNGDLEFVRHHNKKYAGAFPLWVIMELFSFGMLARFFSDMHKQDKKEITERHFKSENAPVSPRHIESWLDALAELRNHCAHYNRLYAAEIRPAPKPLDGADFKQGGGLFDFIYVIKLMNLPLSGNKAIKTSLSALLEEFGDVVDLKVMGFPENWEEILNN